MNKIYTIGYANFNISKFLKVLKSKDIQILVDVRRFPTSKKKDFKKENLIKHLNNEGMEYNHLEALGGFRRESYKKWTLSEEFKKGIEELIHYARENRVVVMCLEQNPSYCHRRFITEEMERRGFEVLHL